MATQLADILVTEPCPFCGREPSQTQTGGSWFVECMNRNCSARPMTMGKEPALAIVRWNARSETDVMDAAAMRTCREYAAQLGYSDVYSALEALEERAAKQRSNASRIDEIDARLIELRDGIGCAPFIDGIERPDSCGSCNEATRLANEKKALLGLEVEIPF